MEQKLSLPATEAMTLATAMVQAKVIASRSGKKQPIISYGIKHGTMNGKPYWFTQDDCQRFQEAIHSIGTELLTTSILPYPQFEQDSPYCYGVDNIEKIKNLCKLIKRDYLFTTIMGKRKEWIDNRISCGNKHKLSFSDEDIQAINKGIQKIAQRLISLEIVFENK